MAKKKKKTSGKSVTWVAVAGIILMGFFSWGCLATAYVNGAEGHLFAEGVDETVSGLRGRGRGLALIVGGILAFMINSVTQIPNLLPVVTWNITHRPGMLVVLFILVALVAACAVGLKIVEKQLEKPVRKPPAP